MIVPHKNFRLNPSRAIHVSGTIDRDLVSRITPQVLQLQSASREPITVYIDSPGGAVSSMEAILGLLKLSDQDSSSACHIITAVTNRASSAAADLLSSGDYAIAYPTSAILYHGIRTWQPDEPLTVEFTSMLGRTLRLSNDFYAMALARKIEDRFSFRFILSRGAFAVIRETQNKPAMTDLECFIAFIDLKLSTDAKKVWNKARQRYGRYKDLFDTMLKKVPGAQMAKMTPAQFEAKSIKVIVDFELRTNSKNNPTWSFRNGGIWSLADDFLLLNEYLSSAGHERLKKWSQRYGMLVLPGPDADEVKAIADEQAQTEKLVEKVQPILEPLWSFFVALCHALQDGENELTGHDAYWLGLVDEVVGDSSLMSLRNFHEFEPDQPDQPEEKVEP